MTMHRNPFSPGPAYHQQITQLRCTGCGAEANAACNCGKPYVPKLKRAAEAVAAHPEKSDRALAKEVGVSPTTMGKARESTVHTGQLDEPRIGLDNRERRMPTRPEPQEEDGPAYSANVILGMLKHFITNFAGYDVARALRDSSSKELATVESVSAQALGELKRLMAAVRSRESAL
jgi:hypothetical protein